MLFTLPIQAGVVENSNIVEGESFSEVTARDASYYSGKLWEYSSAKTNGESSGARKFIADHKANRTGETLSISRSISYSVSISGAITATSKNKVAAQIGMSIGASKSFSVSRTSGSIKKGETCKAYYVPRYSETKVTENEIAYIMNNGKYTKYAKTGKTRTAIVKKPIAPRVEFVYLNNSRALRSGGVTRIETYEIGNDGTWTLIETKG